MSRAAAFGRRDAEIAARRLLSFSPGAYARHILRASWWPGQRAIADALLEHRRVLVKAAHAVGKTHLAAGLVNWHFDCFQPGLTLTTAPTQSQVVDVLWKEVRTQRAGRPGLMPRSPRMETTAEHFAVGYTARDTDGFQGRHAERVLIVFDECTGIDKAIWDAAEGMMTGPGCLWLAICNPTDRTSRAFEEELAGRFHVLTVSALDHPNVAAELAGQAPPYPGAVRLEWVADRLRAWCTPIEAPSRRAGDVEFPPGSGCWHRPGPLFESRVLGRWPTEGADSVWSEAAWQAAAEADMPPDGPPVIGCDVARFGDDWTSMVVRRGPTVLHHETHSGWSTAQTAGRLKQLCAEHCGAGDDPRGVPVFIDDDGVGGGVVDQAAGFSFRGIGAGTRPRCPEDYPNRRSELWFASADRAAEGRMALSRLAPESLRELRRQAMAPRWRVDAQGRRAVEPKEDTKRRIGRSPDDMDALNLAFIHPDQGRSAVAESWW